MNVTERVTYNSGVLLALLDRPLHRDERLVLLNVPADENRSAINLQDRPAAPTALAVHVLGHPRNEAADHACWRDRINVLKIQRFFRFPVQVLRLLRVKQFRDQPACFLAMINLVGKFELCLEGQRLQLRELGQRLRQRRQLVLKEGRSTRLLL